MKLHFKPRILDLIILAVAIAVTAIVSAKVYTGGDDKLYVHITADSGEWIEALDTDKKLEIQGPLGITYVDIEGGNVRILDSPCKNKLCVGMGEIGKENQWIACMPNRVFVRIGGRSAVTGGIDAGTY
ncbi:MAG: NusG domain II-containing protein [Spirochaetes bacterium]|nr:NusG domain II-containing protein [Spirochaetota bacterium]